MSNHAWFSPRVERLCNRYLVTGDAGGYVFLSQKDFRDFKSGNLSAELHEALEENGILITSFNKQHIVNKYRANKAQLFRGPGLHIVVPTKRCSLGCVYCQAPTASINAPGVDMDEGTAREVVKFIFSSPSKEIKIEFQGGEPLLNFGAVEFIVKHALEVNKQKKRRLQFTIVTSLAQMDEQKLDFIVRNRVWPCTSLDGPRELQEKNRPGSYAHIKKWVPILQKRLRSNLAAICVITKDSLSYPKGIVDEYIKFGFKKMRVRPFHIMGRGKNNLKKIGYSSEQYIDFWREMLAYLLKKPILEVGTAHLVKKAIFGQHPLFLDLQSPCGAAINQLAYDFNGDIFTCDEGRMVGGDMFRIGHASQSYKDVMCAQNIKGIVKCSVNDLLGCKRCAFKPYCGVCPVLSYLEYGSPVPRTGTFECRVLRSQFRFIFEAFFTQKSYRDMFTRWTQAKDL